jgi:2',3'-cyclic-nucleotide 2'-phosphodiesterase (5'-nucleotidase family)
MRGGWMNGARLALLSLLLVSILPGPVLAAPSLTILHINDLHGWMLPHPGEGGSTEVGGLARMAALVERSKRGPTLFVAAGDLMQGTNLSNFSRGKAVIEGLGLMGLDASAVGNHDFDYGLETLRRRASEAAFPFLAANVEGPGAEFLTGWVVRRAGPFRVALFGLTTVETPIVTHPDNVRGLTFRSPVETARRLVPDLRRRADLVVCLSHLGLAEDRRLAAAVPGIDVIVGGHTHTMLESPLPVGSTHVVQAGERGDVLGVLELEMKDGRVASASGRLVPVDGSAGEEKKTTALVERYRREAEGILGEVVGRAAVDFIGRREMVRTVETNLGNLVADAVREAVPSDAAVVNGGAIRAGVPAGEVTAAHLYNVLPFDTFIVAFELKGSEVRALLEDGLGGLGIMGGGFPQVSGMSYSFDASAPAGSRLREVRIGGAALRDDETYVVALNDFLAAGGDGYRGLEGKKPAAGRPGYFLRDALADYWKARGEVSRGVEGRIIGGGAE